MSPLLLLLLLLLLVAGPAESLLLGVAGMRATSANLVKGTRVPSGKSTHSSRKPYLPRVFLATTVATPFMAGPSRGKII